MAAEEKKKRSSKDGMSKEEKKERKERKEKKERKAKAEEGGGGGAALAAGWTGVVGAAKEKKKHSDKDGKPREKKASGKDGKPREKKASGKDGKPSEKKVSSKDGKPREKKVSEEKEKKPKPAEGGADGAGSPDGGAKKKKVSEKRMKGPVFLVGMPICYHGIITKEEAIARLLANDGAAVQGKHLVTKGPQGSYNLSVVYKGKILHFSITEVDGYFAINKKMTEKTTLRDLIELLGEKQRRLHWPIALVHGVPAPNVVKKAPTWAAVGQLAGGNVEPEGVAGDESRTKLDVVVGKLQRADFVDREQQKKVKRKAHAADVAKLLKPNPKFGEVMGDVMAKPHEATPGKRRPKLGQSAANFVNPPKPKDVFSGGYLNLKVENLKKWQIETKKFILKKAAAEEQENPHLVVQKGHVEKIANSDDIVRPNFTEKFDWDTTPHEVPFLNAEPGVWEPTSVEMMIAFQVVTEYIKEGYVAEVASSGFAEEPYEKEESRMLLHEELEQQELAAAKKEQQAIEREAKKKAKEEAAAEKEAERLRKAEEEAQAEMEALEEQMRVAGRTTVPSDQHSELEKQIGHSASKLNSTGEGYDTMARRKKKEAAAHPMISKAPSSLTFFGSLGRKARAASDKSFEPEISYVTDGAGGVRAIKSPGGTKSPSPSTVSRVNDDWLP